MSEQVENTKPKKNNKKIVAIVVVIVVALLLIAAVITTGVIVAINVLNESETVESSKTDSMDVDDRDDKREKDSKDNDDSQAKSKTIMIYMCGSDLESKSGIATSNLNDLIESNVDFDNFNIILCAGGTSRWHNDDISQSETSYFKVTEDGLELIKKQSKVDMASNSTLTSFIDYAYENYKGDEYYLMFWDHGCALGGLQLDELTKNILSLQNLNTGLKNTKLNKDGKKFSLVILNNCLMGNLEVANIMSNYGKYLVASEDVMYGGAGLKTFEFLEGIKKTDGPEKIGRSYIDAYSKSMKSRHPGTYITFALIDLGKIKNVVNELDNYFGSIKLDETNFKKIAKIRKDVYEYQKADDRYDMVDLHQLVSKLQPVNGDNRKLLSAIESAVVYKSVTDPYSKGISTYFPETYDWTKVYKTIDFANKYEKFTEDYIAMASKNKKATSMSMNALDVNKTESGFSLQLNDEEKSTFKSAQFIVFEDNGDGTYNTVLSSGDTKIDDNGLVTANVDNKLLSVVDKSDGTTFPLGYLIEVDRTNDYVMYDVPIVLTEPYGKDYVTHMSTALMNIKVYNDGRVERLATRSWGSDSGVDGKTSSNGAILDITDSEKYKSICFLKSARKIEVDANGNYDKLGELSSSQGLAFDPKEEFTFEKTNLDPDKKYVGVFIITDVYENKSSSKLINIK